MTTHSQVINSSLIKKKARALHEATCLIGSAQIRNRGTIGGNLCNASPAADTATPLLVHDAEANITSLDDTRWIPLQDLFSGPKMTILEPDELLTGIRLPVVSGGSSFMRIGRRKGFTLSIVNAAAYLEREDDRVGEISIALGSVAPTPLCIQGLDELQSGDMNDGFIDVVNDICLDQIKPIDDVRGTAEYRRDMTSVLVRRAIRDAWTSCGGVLE
jgi:carbon-monoxide dehydrogenase medium subunit